MNFDVIFEPYVVEPDRFLAKRLSVYFNKHFPYVNLNVQLHYTVINKKKDDINVSQVLIGIHLPKHMKAA